MIESRIVKPSLDGVIYSFPELWNRMRMELPIQIDKERVADFCRRRHITKLALFGSVLTDCFGPDSDVDVLVEFDPEHIPGLIALSGMEREFSELLGRKVDMRTPKDLSRHFRDEVVRSARVQYAA